MVSIVVAMDKNRVIGKDNKLPWHLPADLAYFKSITMGHVIVMGRKTHDSIGRPLPGRKNVVLTRDKTYAAPGCMIMHSVQDVLVKFGDEVIDVIGGAEIIAQFLPYTDKLYMTRIEETFDGDVFFPQINRDDWELISKEKGTTDEKNPYTYDFFVYQRKK
ncbi:dihydrofolate reductase [Aneurinibacillus terranovensis]|uniref:dihydrofolate reductase n=1 Tax=Aneurinibacillus terranovensis TaxID=278991 RepID=UPI000408EB42|nr:dihydrofolate reductase [Aneurinibacillus terranovensis]